MWSDKATEDTPFHHLDGVTIYLAEFDQNPDDDFTTNEQARPPSVGKDALDEDAEARDSGDDGQ